MTSINRKLFLLSVFMGGLGVFTHSPSALAFGPEFNVKELKSLKKIPVPGPSDEMLAQFIVNKKAAIELGKALFWDQHVGSDNLTACATCHFHAGADNRVKNQLNPGELAKDKLFNLEGSGPNYVLKQADYPFSVNDIASSQGVTNSEFLYAGRHGEPDVCKTVVDDVFHIRVGRHKKLNTRKNEQRNTPTVFNAVFNFRNFWDGRANNMFNGVDPFGRRNEDAYIWKYENGHLKKIKLDLPTSSLASQASGPPLSGFEMSCKQRLFHNIARKILNQRILAEQSISKTDSVLGNYTHKRPRYMDLIKKAFRHEFWAGSSVPYSGARPASMDLVDPVVFPMEGKEDAYIKLVEANFAFFFSLAIQMYETTLVSDDTPFDRFADGDTNALTEQQKRGFALFSGRAACIFCHSGPELTSASVSNVTANRLVQVPIGPVPIFHDSGFFNIGVRPTSDDLGVGELDPFGKPMNESMMIKLGLTQFLGNDFDPDANPKPDQLVNLVNDGAFKAPGLRNVELTGPYFHNGGKATLRQVVEFYNRGGDFRNPENLLRPLNLTEQQKEDLVSFLLALTDERVRYERAPFDHPSICVPHGHRGNSTRVYNNGDGTAEDVVECIPAVGKNGVSEHKKLKPFMNLSPFQL